MDHRFNHGWFRVRDGLRLHYRDYPGRACSGTLLCLHGLTRNARDFADFAERYSPRFRVIALDFRGRGESARDPQAERYNALVYAADVVEVLDHLALARAIFVGTSLGGLVTMTLAMIAHQRIEAAILNDVGPELSDVGIERIKAYVGAGASFANWDDAARAIAENNEHLPRSYGQDDWLKMARRLCREAEGRIQFAYDPAIARALTEAGPTPRVDMWPLFDALARKPLLVIRGEESDLLSQEAVEKMRARAPAARFAAIAGVGHAPMLDEPEAIAAIDDFLGWLERR